MWARKSCSPKRPVCMSGSTWDAANKRCVAVKLQKPKPSLEMEFAEQYEDLLSTGATRP
jgi:hypothetical protein